MGLCFNHFIDKIYQSTYLENTLNLDQLEDIDMQALVTSYWGTDDMPQEQNMNKYEKNR